MNCLLIITYTSVLILQLIFLPNSESCIDLFFTSQPNLVSESGVHASLFPRCHHQIIYAKINLKIYYPPPYERLVWDYSKAELTNIRKSLFQIN